MNVSGGVNIILTIEGPETWNGLHRKVLPLLGGGGAWWLRLRYVLYDGARSACNVRYGISGNTMTPHGMSHAASPAACDVQHGIGKPLLPPLERLGIGAGWTGTISSSNPTRGVRLAGA